MPVENKASPPRGRRRRARATDRPTLDVIEAKVRPPALRPGVLPRAALVNGLRREAPRVVAMVAPAGYGKTTLLAQWAAADTRRVAWLSLDAHDNDAFALLKHVVAAVDGGEEVDRRLLASLAADQLPAWPLLFDQAAKAFRSLRHPFLFVLDNVDLLHAGEARRVLLAVVATLPDGSTTALASRSTPKLPAARLRARGPVREVGVEELAFSDRDARLVVQKTDQGLSERQASEIVAACEGWPTGLYLAALAAGGRTRSERPVGPAGSDRYLADYMRAEFLSQLSAKETRFLRRTAILDELIGPLCNAVLRDDGSEQELRKLARRNFVLPVDRARGTYRVLRLFRDVLARELAADEPRLVPVLHRRAADWYEARNNSESALGHAQNAGDARRVAALVTAIALPASSSGRAGEIERALAAFEERWPLERYPAVALHGSRLHALRGRTAEAQRWLAVAERGARRAGPDAAALRPRIAVVRAALCRRGPRRMLADARTAVARLPRNSQWYPSALHMHACAALLLGATDEAEALLAEVTALAGTAGHAQTTMLALSQQSLLARDRGNGHLGATLAAQALEAAAPLDGDPTCAIALVAAAHMSLRRGRWAEAREHVTAAEPLTPFVTDALPWLAVATRLELARCYIGLRDVEAARALVWEIERLLKARPLLGVLVEQAHELRNEVATFAHHEEAPAGLTPAELRLLPLLATHLSFREIADELRISRNTVKTQAISIYRKLGVSGRSQAIAVASEFDTEGQVAV
jgi:LuxR family transcriptional regulator, maltose regulon positive regulatory protein